MRGLTTIAAGMIGLAALLSPCTAHAEPDIRCDTGQATGLDTSSPGFVRPYPQVCVDKFLAAVHAEGFTAPGGDTELVSLGKMACHALDVDPLDSGHVAENTVRAAEPKLAASAPDPSYRRDTIYDDFVMNIVMKSLCP